MAKSSACPDLGHYQRLASGQLPDADQQALLGHLEGCATCAQKLHRLPEPDTLVGLLRQAETLVDQAAEGTVARLVERLSKLRPGEAHSRDKETRPPREPAGGADSASLAPRRTPE